MDDYVKMKRKFALGFIDVDRFKTINDTYGHDFGDKLLIVFSNTVKYMIRKQDVFARIGGDEFVLLYHDMDTLKSFLDLIQESKHSLKNPS